jgi:DNA (cytosine-5)-methyltransferase 1
LPTTLTLILKCSNIGIVSLLAVDIFSGAGGLAAGVARAGFETDSVYDNDIASCATLKRNLGAATSCKRIKVFKADVSLTDFSGFQDRIELLTGGPPCQPFSVGGKHVAHNDDRNQFPHAVRAVREIRPKAFAFENVLGLMRPRFRCYLEYIRLQLSYPEILAMEVETWEEHYNRLQEYHTAGDHSGLTYHVLIHAANAADYGVPQQRDRVFIVGFQQGVGVGWHFPSPTHSKQTLLREQAFGSYWERHEVAKRYRPTISAATDGSLFETVDCLLPWATTRDAISDLPDPRKHQCGKRMDPMHVFKPGARSYKGHEGSRLDEPAKTLKAGVHGVPGGENMFRDASGALRYFTLRECARLQTFPDSYLFSGSWSAAMKQLGNAVPVKLAEIFATSIEKVLRKNGTPD